MRLIIEARSADVDNDMVEHGEGVLAVALNLSTGVLDFESRG